MGFSSYTLIVTYFMATLGIASISLVEAIGSPFIVFSSVLVSLSCLANIKKKEAIAGVLWNLLAAGVFVFFMLDYLAFSKSLITSASRFLTVLLILKLFDLKKNRDYLIVFSLVFFLILAAAASTVSPVFLVILSLFVINGIFAMVVFTIKRDLQENLRKDASVPSGVFGPAFFASIVGVSGISILITFSLFFVIPRMGIGLFERKTLNTVKVTGFSERVDLGAIGPVKQ
ncbi:MAG: transglutaminaseTgpA domain-containing protein, partial [Deltaproteobacteria bacterium]|nr:transglutaminaseTgpA domain-containing protein [Deltaproteobacteria bacterium]